MVAYHLESDEIPLHDSVIVNLYKGSTTKTLVKVLGILSKLANE